MLSSQAGHLYSRAGASRVLEYPSLTAALGRLIERLREGVPLAAFCRGWWLRRRLNARGLVLALPGGPLPLVKNRGGSIDVESCTLEPGVRLELYPGAHLHIGKGVYLNRNVHIVAADRISIGRGTKIGWDVVIMDTNLHGHSGQSVIARPIIIEEDVWIGCRAVILKGVRIGRGAVVAAGAIVTRDVPAHAVVAGPRADVISMGQDPAA
jgi:acetyltransferase-like isoleucine patch superfamily enzyme